MRMSIRPKGVAGIIAMIIFIAAGVIVAYSSGIAHSRSAAKIGYVGKNGRDNWSGNYQLLDGKMRRTLHFENTQSIMLQTTTKSGTLSIKIQNTTGNTIFAKSNLGTETHSIPVDGDVVVTISASKHTGSFAINC